MVFLIFIGASSDDPTAPEPDVHPFTEFVSLRAGNIQVASATKSITNGSHVIARGVKASVDVVFFDEIGNPLIHKDNEFLSVEIADSVIASWQTDQPGDFTVELEGLSLGTTGVVFRLMNGAVGNTNAHADVISAKIPLVISE